MPASAAIRPARPPIGLGPSEGVGGASGVPRSNIEACGVVLGQFRCWMYCESGEAVVGWDMDPRLDDKCSLRPVRERASSPLKKALRRFGEKSSSNGTNGAAAP